MTWFETVENLVLDITSYCNAKCGSCIRNLGGSINVEGLSLEHLSVDLVKELFNSLKNKKIRIITFNGTYGDACMHPQFIDIIEIIADTHPAAAVVIETNGSYRSESWWADLATSLSKIKSHIIHFAVDGLEDTHSIYRRNTDFNKLVKNIKAFNTAGGSSEIITTIFDHNKHQLDQIEELALKLKCVSYMTRRSFTSDIEIFDDSGNNVVGSITAPKIGNFKKRKVFAENIKKNTTITRHPISYTDVKYSMCQWHIKRSIQIDPWGYVWPCCWIGKNGHNFDEHIQKHGHKVSLKFLENSVNFRKDSGYDYEFHNLKNNSLQAILNGKWFNETLPDSFTTKPLGECVQNCGMKQVSRELES